jgi:hypothetical protein
MFGGTASDGFKIKAKHLDRRGRQVIAAMIRDGLLPAAPSPGGAP